MFGDASSSGGIETKPDAGANLFISTTEMKMGAIAGEKENTSKQSNTSQEEGPTPNFSAFWQEVVHTEDRSNINATGMTPYSSKNSVTEECQKKVFSEEEKIESKCGPLQKKPSLDKGDDTNILNRTRDSEQSEKDVERGMEHDVPKDGNVSTPNEDAQVPFS